jgi:hypothetical protein
MTAISHPEDGRPGRAGAQVAEHKEPATLSPAAHRNLLRSPVLQGVAALAVYLLIWLLTSARGMINHLGWATVDQKSMDPNFYTWGLRWWPYAIGHGLNPLYSHEIAGVVGHSLAWVTTVPPLALLASPLTIVAGPITSFNLLSAIALPVSAWAAFVLCRRLTGQFWPALVGGAVFGFSAYEMNHSAAGQLNLTYSLLVPILAYLILVWRDGSIRTRTFVILAGLTMALQFYLFLETFADLTAILAVGLLVGFALAGRHDRPQIARLARVVGLAYAVAAVLAAPYLAYMLTVKTPKLTSAVGMDVASLVLPRQTRTFGIAWLTHIAAEPSRVSEACYVGIPLILLVVLLAVTSWSSKLVRFLTCMLVFIVVAALGSALYFEGSAVVKLPWGELWRLPILRNAYPSRLMLFAYLVLAVATALWLAGPARRVSWARWLLGAFVIAFIALDTPTIAVDFHSSVPRFITSGQYQRQLSRGEVVVVISTLGNVGLLWQAQTDFYLRISGGYINQAITRGSDLPDPVQDLSQGSPADVAQFAQYVKADHVGAILLDARHEPLWVGIFRRMGLHGHLIDGVIVYKTNGCQSCRLPALVS